MSEFVCGKVECPFFKDIKSQKQKIVCEGVENGTIISLSFARKRSMQKYIEQNCCNKYKECRIAKMLYQKYDND